MSFDYDYDHISVIETNSTNEAFKALEKVDESLDLVNTDIYQWKWVIIILHNCVQCFMVLALEGTNQVDVIKDNTKNKRKIAEYLSPQKEWRPDLAQVDDFMSLFNKIKSFENSKRLDSSHEMAIEVLAHYRNDFVHFFPKGLSIFVESLPRELQIIIEIINYLLFNSGKVAHKFSQEQIVVMKDHLNSIRYKLSEASKLMKADNSKSEEKQV